MNSLDAIRADSARLQRRAIVAIDSFEDAARRVTSPTAGCRAAPGRSCFAGRLVPLPWRTSELITRDSLEAVRSHVVSVLDSTIRIVPGDRTLLGQRVELLIMGGRFADAARALPTECRIDAWECAMLRMYILHTTRRFVEAEAVLDSALGLMPPAIRCTWAPIWPVLGDSAVAYFADLPCAERSEFEARVWWMSDPSHLIPGNERRTEHYVRGLRHELLIDWQWLSSRSTRTLSAERTLRHVRDLVSRPDASDGSAPSPESLHALIVSRGWYDSWQTLQSTDSNGDCMVAAATFVRELPYSSEPLLLNGWDRDPIWNITGRIPRRCVAVYRAASGLQLVPRPSAILDPFRSSPTAWAPEGWRRNRREEFTPRYGPFATLTDHQLAFFRDTSRTGLGNARARARLVVAVTGLHRDPMLIALRRQAPGETWDVGLVITDTFPARARDSVNVRAPRGPLASRYSWQLDAPWRPHVISIEAIGADRVGIARLRAGAGPPENPAQRIAISDILLFEPDTSSASGEPPRTLDALLSRTLGTTVIDARRPVGLFWETYGLSATDTATVALSVVRDRGGLLERLGQSLRILDQPSGATVRYAVPPGRDASAAALGQSLRIALGALGPGEYTIALQVTVPGQAPVGAHRRIVVQ